MRDRDRETEEQSEASFRTRLSGKLLLKLKKSKEAVILPGISPTGDCGPALHELVPGSRTMHNAAKVLPILNLELGVWILEFSETPSDRSWQVRAFT